MDSCSLKPKRKYNKRRPLIDESPKIIIKDQQTSGKTTSSNTVMKVFIGSITIDFNEGIETRI